MNKITIHCSATKPTQHVNAKIIDGWHKDRGWQGIGYHYVILRDGTLERGRPLKFMGAHVKGHNQDNIGICMVGGIDEQGNAENNFTDAQFQTMKNVVTALQDSCGIANEDIKGHRDYSPDLNGDGKVTPDEFYKQCPCFNVWDYLK